MPCVDCLRDRFQGTSQRLPTHAMLDGNSAIPAKALSWVDDTTAEQLLDKAAASPLYVGAKAPRSWPPCVGICWGGRCNLKLYYTLYKPHSSGCCYAGAPQATDSTTRAVPEALFFEASSSYVCWEVPDHDFEHDLDDDDTQGDHYSGRYNGRYSGSDGGNKWDHDSPEGEYMEPAAGEDDNKNSHYSSKWAQQA